MNIYKFGLKQEVLKFLFYLNYGHHLTTSELTELMIDH